MLRRTFIPLALALTARPVYSQTVPSREYLFPQDLRLQVGRELPPFDLPKLEGGRLNQRELLGRPTVLTFFFSDCAPCIRDVPALNAFKHKYEEFNVVAITHDSRPRAERFKREHGLNWQILIEAKDYFSQNGVTVFPQFSLLNKQGILVSATYGRELGDERGTVILAGLEAWVKQFQ